MTQKLSLYFLFLTLTLTSGCVSHQELLYFRNDEAAVRRIDSTLLAINNYAPLEIQPNDVLSITVKSFDQKLATPFNMGAGEGGITQTTSPVNTYRVDGDGTIDFPVLGRMELAGKTVKEIRENLTRELKSYLEQPSVNIRLLSFRVSVLGEVRNPGSFTVDSDRITLLEALALAQDLTPYGNTKNVFVIREQNGGRTFGEINLQSTRFINSEFYYLRQGDVIYVEPRKDKQAIVRDNAAEYATLVVAGVQAIVSIATLIIIAGR